MAVEERISGGGSGVSVGGGDCNESKTLVHLVALVRITWVVCVDFDGWVLVMGLIALDFL
jgi:preprotein translocase subunit SecG